MSSSRCTLIYSSFAGTFKERRSSARSAFATAISSTSSRNNSAHRSNAFRTEPPSCRQLSGRVLRNFTGDIALSASNRSMSPTSSCTRYLLVGCNLPAARRSLWRWMYSARRWALNSGVHFASWFARCFADHGAPFVDEDVTASPVRRTSWPHDRCS